MKNKWSSEKVKEVHRWLIKRWPESFTQGPDLRPLSLQIHKEVLKYRDENPQLSTRVLQEALKRHTTSYGYLYGLSKHAKRYDLDGKPVSDVSPEHREQARSTLKLKQKEAQRIRKEARQSMKAQRKPLTDRTRPPSAARPLAENQAAGSAGGSGATSPVIKYKQSRRRLIKPDERAVDLAS